MTMRFPKAVHALSRSIAVGIGLLFGFGAQAEAEPAMWVVKDGDSTVYLLGTMHMVKPGTNWRSEKLDAALQSSDEFWMEADLEANPAIVQTYALNFGMDSRKSLASSIGEENFAKFKALAEEHHIPTRDLHQMRPWLASMVLTQAVMKEIGYKPELGVDRTLQKEAIAAGKSIRPFETASQQMGFLADLPDRVGAKMLVETLEQVDDGAKLLGEMESAWVTGDVKQLQGIVNVRMRKDAPELYDALLVRRNTSWVKQIDTMLKGSGTQFIAVGAGHLLGADSVLAQLGKLGYKVERY
jgi:uncharacterized protein